ncbi:MAG: DEAD/DEAH box helicase [Spartobacteria bacterium]|nr:DEAD/DEAH box helicase [Spartobacteria bacterium]
MTNEAFARVKIDQQLKSVGWEVDDGQSITYEQGLSDGKQADYVLNDRDGRPLAVIEAKRFSENKPLETACEQAKHYAEQLGVDFIFLANGKEAKFWDYKNEAFPHDIKTIFDQENLERRVASRKVRQDLMAVEIDRRIAGGGGRTYQIDAIDAVCKGIKQGRRKFLLEMATGTGKTRTGAALIKRLFEASHATRVLFLVDRISLAKQTDEEFQDLLQGYSSYMFKNGRFRSEKQICVTTLQSMINEYHRHSSGYFDLIIVDECHRSIYGKWRAVLDHFDGIKVGLTATPCIASDDHTQNEEEMAFVRDTMRFFELTEPTFRYTLKDAIADGNLVPYHIYKAKTVKTMADGGFEVAREEIDWDALDEETRAEFEKLFGDEEKITVDPKALERKFTIPERNRAIVREYREVLENGYTAHDGVRRFPQDGKAIVFAVSKRHAATLAKMFDDAFADKKPTPETRYADYVVSDLRGEGEGDADAVIKRFKKEEFPKILVSVNMLDTGFDCPEVVSLIFARYTESSILYQQMRGRGTRKAPHIKKNRFTIFDFVGVTDFHGDDEEPGTGGPIVVSPGKPTKPTKPRLLLTLDIHDEIDPASRAWLTTDENGNIVREQDLQAHRDETGAKFERWYIENEYCLDDEPQKRLIRMIGEYVQANAESVDEFTMAHFSMPPFRNEGGKAWALGIFRDQAALESLLQSLNDSVFNAAPDKEETSAGGETPQAEAAN